MPAHLYETSDACIELGVDGFNSLWQILGQCRANREALQGQGENCNYDS